MRILAVLALAAAIGVLSAVFALTDGVSRYLLACDEVERLVALHEYDVRESWMELGLSHPTLEACREEKDFFVDLAAYVPTGFNLSGRGLPERIGGARVSVGLFPLLGVQPLHGRCFSAEPSPTGGNREVVIGYDLWQRRYNGETDLVGQAVKVDGEPHTIVGIMPRGFYFPRSAELWVPRVPSSAAVGDRQRRDLSVVARLAPGVSREQASAHLEQLAQRMEQQYPETNAGWRLRVVSLREDALGPLLNPGSLIVLACLLLFACAIVNLLLTARLETQQAKAGRQAGASERLQTAGQILIGSVGIALLGGALGFMAGFSVLEHLISVLPLELPAWAQIAPSLRCIGITFTVAMGAALLSAVVPVLCAVTGFGGLAGRWILGAALAGFAFLMLLPAALSLILLIQESLMVKSYYNRRAAELDVDITNVLTVLVHPLPESKYPDSEQVRTFYQRLLRDLNRLSEVQAAGVYQVPFQGRHPTHKLLIEDCERTSETEPEQDAYYRVVTSGYFDVMKIPILTGQDFVAGDRIEAPGAVIVNDTMARRCWPADDPKGKRLRLAASEDAWLTVVGVVADARHDYWRDDSLPAVYRPQAQDPRRRLALVVRTTQDPQGLAAAVRERVAALDGDQPLGEVLTMEEVLTQALAFDRLQALTFGFLVGDSLLLVGIGLYGLVFFVSLRGRRHLVLGEKPPMVRMAARGLALGLAITGGAVFFGLISAAAGAEGRSERLFQVSPADPGVLLECTALFLTGALAIIVLAVWRAVRVARELAQALSPRQ